MEKSLGHTNFEAHRLSAAFPTLSEPGAHGLRQTLGLNAKSRLDETFGKGERVVKFGFTGEIAHTEIIEPIKRAWFAPIFHNDVDAELPSEHATSIA